MRERSRPTAIQHALRAVLLLCSAGSCTGPGLEPPGQPAEHGDHDAGDPTAGGAAHGGSGGSGGEPTVEPPTGGSADSGDDDAGEAALDASVDDDGGSDPAELEP